MTYGAIGRRLLLALTGAALLGIPFLANAAGPFDQKLSPDQRIVQAVNRLTFGARPGDVDAVRQMGLEKWIELQLHPEKIAENPVLETRLAPLETLRLQPAQIIKDYPNVPPGLIQMNVNLNELLGGSMISVMNGTAEVRKKALDALDPEKRMKVLAVLPPQQFEGLPEIQKEIEAARKAQQEERTKQQRKLQPPLMDLLGPVELPIAQRGSPEERAALFAALDPAVRRQVAGALMPPQSLAGFPEMRRMGMVDRQPQQVAVADLKEGKLYRALYSNRQLEEVLVDFWFNHFNVFEGKAVQVANGMRPLLASYERDAIRPHVLGHFKDLLLAVARHPAMLYYLDNWESVGPDALDAFNVGPFAGPGINLMQNLGRQAHGLNENYGRELMELHTLGVNGGYSQDDVITVARCFTGWTVAKPATDPQFTFAAFMHDKGEKTVLGHKIAAGGGEQDGVEVIDILARHPSTAKFISRKLAQHFVADDPPASLVEKMAATFTKTDGDLRAVLETMFTSTEFNSQGAWQAKMKTPLEMVVSSVRATGAEATDTFTLAQRVADLGEPLYGKIEPTGYPNTGEPWMNTAGLLGRINFAAALISGQIPGVKVTSAIFFGKDFGKTWEEGMPAIVAKRILNTDPSPQTQAAIVDGLQGKEEVLSIATLVMSSPEFQRR
jgi:uncharacterized protein (DUF1800 family)